MTQQPRTNDATTIHHHDVAGVDQLLEIGENGVRERASRAIHDEQPTAVATIEGMLSDELRGEIEIVVGRPGSGFVHRCKVKTPSTRRWRMDVFDPPSDWKPVVGEARPLRIVWALEALPKRRNDWTTNDITRFRAARLVIAKRFYGRR